MEYRIRTMGLEDIPQVAEIERECFSTTWPPTSFKRELGNGLGSYLVASSPADDAINADNTVVAVEANSAPPLLRALLARVHRLFPTPSGAASPTRNFILGYVGVWFMADEAHITAIAVREARRRLGIGELLLMGAVELAIAQQARVVTLEVRVSNTGAHALYEKYGFRKVGIRKGYYADNREDAVIMSADAILSNEYKACSHTS